MQLELGCPVRCTDGPFGELEDVVVDPISLRVTHLVVQPHHRHHLARLVPVALAKPETDGPGLALRCTAEEARRLAPVEEFSYLRFGELPVADPDWDVGIETVLVQPYYEAGTLDGNPFDLDPHISFLYDRIPKGEVEIRRASEVLSSDGDHLGHVDGLVVHADDHVTHIVLARGHLWGRRNVTIPIGAVTSVKTDSVRLNLTKDQVGALEAVPFGSRASALP